MTAADTMELGVWLLGERAGTLGLKDGRLRFRYEARWLQKPGATPLSQSLPLLCTAVYPTLTTKMAMKLGSKYSFAEVQVRHWELFAVAAGLSKAQTRKRLVRMAEQLPSSARRLQTESFYRDHALIERIACLVEQRCELTLRRFNAD